MSEVHGGGFNAEKQRAIERMKEMNSRSKYRQGTAAHPPQEEKREENTYKSPITLLSGFNIPFLSDISRDSDISLIIGLLLILMTENSDRLLLLALVYILM